MWGHTKCDLRSTERSSPPVGRLPAFQGESCLRRRTAHPRDRPVPAGRRANGTKRKYSSLAIRTVTTAEVTKRSPRKEDYVRKLLSSLSSPRVAHETGGAGRLGVQPDRMTEAKLLYYCEASSRPIGGNNRHDRAAASGSSCPQANSSCRSQPLDVQEDGVEFGVPVRSGGTTGPLAFCCAGPGRSHGAAVRIGRARF